MPRFNSLIGKRIEVSYRAGDIHLVASGTLVADSGRAAFIEERFSQQGKDKTLRLEIPYQCILRLSEISEASEPARASRGSKDS